MNFPKEIYVIVEQPDDANEVPFLIAHTDVEALSSPGVMPMARYVLAGHGEVVNETKYTETTKVPQ